MIEQRYARTDKKTLRYASCTGNNADELASFCAVVTILCNFDMYYEILLVREIKGLINFFPDTNFPRHTRKCHQALKSVWQVGPPPPATNFSIDGVIQNIPLMIPL